MSQFQYKESYRRNLPHIQPPGATIFVTFRLAGSIPAPILRQLLEERQDVERQLALISDNAERTMRADLEERRLFGKWDQALDTSLNGPYWLRDEAIAKLVVDSLHYQDNQRYCLDAFCVMPNHVHLVCTPLAQNDETYYAISSIMHAMKRHTGFRANQILKRSGAFWQHENYDRYARSEAEFQRIINYVLNNPVTAGFVSSPTEWKWSYSRANL